MIRNVQIKDIHPNPFQHRKANDPEAIKALAEEIGKVGLWVGALRGREAGGRIELCFGHRRLEALKHLGRKEVEVDVVPLSDEDMSLQALAENLQRRGLNDAEKADGIKKCLDLLMKAQLSNNRKVKAGQNDRSMAIRKIQEITGLSQQWLSDLLTIADFPEEAKEKIREGFSGRASIEANHIGGAAAITTFAEKGVKQDAVFGIGKALRDIKDKEVKEQVRAKVVQGDITTPEEVVETARRLKGTKATKEAKEKKTRLPPDLTTIIAGWTSDIKGWIKALDEILSKKENIDYIDTAPTIARLFREQVAALIQRLEKLR
jgi:ParB-like chromosome segregation protein Spo0J